MISLKTKKLQINISRSKNYKRHPYKVFLGIMILSVVGSVIAFIISDKSYQHRISQPTSSTAYSISSDPTAVVKGFFDAVKTKNKSKAKEYLSSNANTESFQSTLEETSSSPSLYEIDFTYSITGTKIDNTNNKAFINVGIVVNDQTLPTVLTLTKDTKNKWLIVDSQTVSTNTNTNFNQDTVNVLSRGLLIANGPIELYLTDPEGHHSGYNSVTKQLINDISGIVYTDQKGINLKQFSLTNFVGSWDLQLVSTQDGKYMLATQALDTGISKNINGSAKLGSTYTYKLTYSKDKGLQLNLVK